MQRYYVYSHTRIDKDEIFYIGKGTINEKGKFYKTIHNRAYKKEDRTMWWKHIVNKTPYKIRIIKYFDKEIDALIYETCLISFYKLKEDGGTLVNLVRNTVENTGKSILLTYENVKGIEVYQYSLNGEFLNKHISYSKAAKAVGALASDIREAALLKSKSTCKGFQWRLEKFDSITPIKVKKVRTEKLVEIFQYDLNGNFIAKYRGSKEASELTGTNRTAIRNVLSEIAQTANDFYWSYFDSFDKITNIKKLQYVYQYQKNELIQIFDSIKDCAKYFNVHVAYISTSCRRKTKCKGFYLSYEKQS